MLIVGKISQVRISFLIVQALPTRMEMEISDGGNPGGEGTSVMSMPRFQIPTIR